MNKLEVKVIKPNNSILTQTFKKKGWKINLADRVNIGNTIRLATYKMNGNEYSFRIGLKVYI